MNLNTEDYPLRMEATCVVFSYVLRKRFEWLRGKSQAGIVGLNEVEADKIVRLLDKVWSQRDKESRKSRLFHFPVVDVNDKYGRRIAFASALDGKHNLLTSDKRVNSVLDSMLVIDASSTPSARTLKIHEDERDWGVVKLIEPQITGPDLNRLIQNRFLLPPDSQFLEGFSEACKELEGQEIIAIGRHESPDKTRESLLYEFGRWIVWTDECLEHLSRGEEQLKERLVYCAWQCWSFARQCILKSRDERPLYERGYNRFMQNALPNEALLTSFKKAQQPAGEIWDGYEVAPLVFPSFYCWTFANYLTGTLRGENSFKDVIKRPPVDAEETQKAFFRLKYFNSIDPSERPYNFNPDVVGSAYGTRESENLIAPPEIWSGSENLGRFTESLRSVFEHIKNDYLEPDLLKSRRAHVD